jgi:parallel beta-helix repeat protein
LISKGVHYISEFGGEKFLKVNQLRRRQRVGGLGARKLRPVSRLIVTASPNKGRRLTIDSSMYIGGHGYSNTTIVGQVFFPGHAEINGNKPVEVTLQDLSILDSPDDGVTVSYSSKVTIKNCRISGSNCHGIFIGGVGTGTKCALVDTIVENSNWNGVCNHAVYRYASDKQAGVWLAGRNTRISNNCKSEDIQDDLVGDGNINSCNRTVYLVHPLRSETVSTDYRLWGEDWDEQNGVPYRYVDEIFSTIETKK